MNTLWIGSVKDLRNLKEEEEVDAIITRETGIAPKRLESGTKMSYAVDSREELIAKVVQGN